MMSNKQSQKRSWAVVAAALCALIVILAGVGHGLAHVGATGIVKERMDIMKSLKDDMKTISDMFRGRIPYSTAVVRENANRMKNHALDYERLFPPGSDKHPSEASPRIWSEQTRFGKQWIDMADAARTLAAVAQDQWKARDAFGSLGKTCSACHDDYRIEKK